MKKAQGYSPWAISPRPGTSPEPIGKPRTGIAPCVCIFSNYTKSLARPDRDRNMCEGVIIKTAGLEASEKCAFFQEDFMNVNHVVSSATVSNSMCDSQRRPAQ
jgi:hypothetical protein